VGYSEFPAYGQILLRQLSYLRTVIVTAALRWGFSLELAPLPLTFQQWAGFTPYTSPFGLAGSCVFTKQSPEPILCDPSLAREASIIANVRDYFAEFLNEGYLAHLRLLALPTCVGLRYGLS